MNANVDCLDMNEKTLRGNVRGMTNDIESIRIGVRYPGWLISFTINKLWRKLFKTMDALILFLSSVHPESKEEIELLISNLEPLIKGFSRLIRTYKFSTKAMLFKNKNIRKCEKRLEQLSDFLDTYEISSDEQIIKDIEESDKNIENGNTVSVEDFLHSLNV